MKIDHLYEQILSSEPSSATFFLILSRLKEEGHLKRVIQECKKALSQYPFDVSLRQLLAESYYGGVPKEIVRKVRNLLTDDLWNTTESFCKKYYDLSLRTLNENGN